MEVKHPPLPAIQIFHQCTLRWYESGCLPDQMSESKQVCIPKINKISENNALKVQDVRPISILSIFWRIYSSAWVKSDQVKKWTKRYLRDKVAAWERGPQDWGTYWVTSIRISWSSKGLSHLSWLEPSLRSHETRCFHSSPSAIKFCSSVHSTAAWSVDSCLMVWFLLTYCLLNMLCLRVTPLVR